jgi:NADPH:quinone reductase-like Zn-dependent oxidoreductase
MVEQHRLLARVSAWVDQGVVRSTMTRLLEPIDAANLRAAHRAVETRGSVGKTVLSGWSTE